MKSVFNLDGPLFSALNKLTDLIVLNLLFVVCSLPIVTAGASFTALYYVALKMKEGEEGYVVRSFFHSFKQNFRQALVIWLILLAAGVVMFLDFWIMRSYKGTMGSVLRISVYLGVLIWGMIFLYVFPLLARFENSIKNTIQNALLLAIANVPKTIIMLVIMFGSIFLTVWNATTLIWGILIWLLIGFSAIAYVNSILLVPIIHKLMPPQEEEETDGDVWVMPDEPEETAKSSETADPEETAKSFETADSEETAKSSETASPEEVAKSSETAKPEEADTAKEVLDSGFSAEERS